MSPSKRSLEQSWKRFGVHECHKYQKTSKNKAPTNKHNYNPVNSYKNQNRNLGQMFEAAKK